MFSTDYSKWSEKIKADTGVLLESYASFKSADVDDWEGKAWSIYSRRGLDRASGLYFEGPVGGGKHTAVASFMQAAKESEYDVLIFTPKNMPRNSSDYEEFEKHLDALLDESINNGKECVLVFDGLEKYEFVDDLLELLAYYVGLYRNYVDDFPPIFVILISNKSMDIPSILNKNLYSVKFEGTTLEQRIRFLKQNGKSVAEKIAPEELAEIIGDCTYGELSSIVKNVEMKMLSAGVISFGEDEIKEFASPKKNNDNASDGMNRIADKLGDLIDKLPDALAGMGTRVVEKEVQKEKKPELPSLTENPGEYKSAREKEINEMPPMELAIQLYGEEMANVILRVGKQKMEQAN